MATLQKATLGRASLSKPDVEKISKALKSLG